MVLNYKMTLAEALQRASVFLQEHNVDASATRDYWAQVFDLSFTEVVLNMHNQITEEQAERFNEVLNRLAQHEPIQYIIGKADFVGETYFVTPATLIPREDTYGLIEMGREFLKDKPSAAILDIGTGSGILAIELAKISSQLDVIAVDISSEAIEVARRNAEYHQVNVQFVLSDLLTEIPKETKFDLIVSNPPYIAEDELDLMDESVKRFEPSQALFAENNGLAIYQQLAKQLPQYIKTNGQILLEIGFRQGQAVQQLFQEAFPNAIVSIHQDLNQNDRYIKVQLEKG